MRQCATLKGYHNSPRMPDTGTRTETLKYVRGGSWWVGADTAVRGALQEILSRLPEGTSDYAYIASMAVDDSYRRQGVAIAMLEQAEQVAGTYSPLPVPNRDKSDMTPVSRLSRCLSAARVC